MSYDKTVKDVEQYTGLDYHYILKCVRELPLVFNNELIERGDNNSVLFSSNAMAIFDKIKQMKDDNQSLKTMRLYFQNTFNKTDKTIVKSEEVNHQNDITKMLIEKIDATSKQTFDAFRETIKTKDEYIFNLNKQLLLLTDGKNPEDFKKEQEKKQEELYNLKLEVQKKTQELEFTNKELEKTLNQHRNYENIKEIEMKSLKEDEKNNSKKRIDLLEELELLEGKWLSGKKRKELLKQLQELL